ASAAAAWDPRVFVWRGAAGAHLRARAAALTSFVERQPGVTPAALAASLAAELQPGGSRLAVVAASTSDLLAKLRRTSDRLADPSFPPIPDPGGPYLPPSPPFTPAPPSPLSPP